MTSPYYISTDKSKLSLEVIFDYLSNQSYWAKGRSMEAVEKTIKNSLCFGVYDAQNKQVGFARVVTDYTIFAWLMDVFILSDCQGKGLGKMLMAEIMAHKDLQEIKRWGLATNDAHDLYKKFGFNELSKPQNMMEFIIANPSLQ